MSRARRPFDSRRGSQPRTAAENEALVRDLADYDRAFGLDGEVA